MSGGSEHIAATLAAALIASHGNIHAAEDAVRVYRDVLRAMHEPVAAAPIGVTPPPGTLDGTTHMLLRTAGGSGYRQLAVWRNGTWYSRGGLWSSADATMTPRRAAEKGWAYEGSAP